MNLQSIAHDLAAAHSAGSQDDVVGIYWLPDPDGRELRLIEVMRSVRTTHEIMPFRFTPTDDVPVPSVMILVSEEEWRELQAGRLQLPESWGPDALGRLRKMG